MSEQRPEAPDGEGIRRLTASEALAIATSSQYYPSKYLWQTIERISKNGGRYMVLAAKKFGCPNEIKPEDLEELAEKGYDIHYGNEWYQISWDK